jgi:hypothetical protein
MSGLPTDTKERKMYPICTGVLDYFPLAIAEVARVSLAGNLQHCPGEPLHWDRSKSANDSDALARHFIDRGKIDIDGQRHSAKMAWRALAILQKEKELETEQEETTAVSLSLKDLGEAILEWWADLEWW